MNNTRTGRIAVTCTYADLAALWKCSEAAAGRRMAKLADAYGSAPWIVEELSASRGRGGIKVNVDILAEAFPTLTKPPAHVGERIEELESTQEAMMVQIRNLREQLTEERAANAAFRAKAAAWFARGR